MVGSATVFAGVVVATVFFVGMAGILMLSARLTVVALWPGILLAGSSDKSFLIALVCWAVMAFSVALLYQVLRRRKA